MRRPLTVLPAIRLFITGTCILRCAEQLVRQPRLGVARGQQVSIKLLLLGSQHPINLRQECLPGTA